MQSDHGLTINELLPKLNNRLIINKILDIYDKELSKEAKDMALANVTFTNYVKQQAYLLQSPPTLLMSSNNRNINDAQVGSDFSHHKFKM